MISGLKAAMLKVIQGDPTGCCFSKILEALPEARGDFAIEKSACRNVVYWQGFSEEAIEAIAELMDDKLVAISEIKPDLVNLLLYEVRSLSLPVALRDRDYLTPRWKPAILKAL